MNKIVAEINKTFQESQLSEYYDSIQEMIEDKDHCLNDNIHELADSNTEIYTYTLYEMLPELANYVDQARGDGLLSGNETIERQIMIGHYCKLEEEFYQEFNDFKEKFECNEEAFEHEEAK